MLELRSGNARQIDLALQMLPHEAQHLEGDASGELRSRLEIRGSGLPSPLLKIVGGAACLMVCYLGRVESNGK